MHVSKRPANAAGAVVVGMAFGAGWTPCIGPILASILLLAGSQGETGRAALLLAVYSVGLGLPFLIAGAAFTRVSRSMQRIKRYFPAIKTISGLFLILIGVLIAVGRFQQLNGFLSATAFQLRGWSEANPDRARLCWGAASCCWVRSIRLSASFGDDPSFGRSVLQLRSFLQPSECSSTHRTHRPCRRDRGVAGVSGSVGNRRPGRTHPAAHIRRATLSRRGVPKTSAQTARGRSFHFRPRSRPERADGRCVRGVAGPPAFWTAHHRHGVPAAAPSRR